MSCHSAAARHALTYLQLLKFGFLVFAAVAATTRARASEDIKLTDMTGIYASRTERGVESTLLWMPRGFANGPPSFGVTAGGESRLDNYFEAQIGLPLFARAHSVPALLGVNLTAGMGSYREDGELAGRQRTVSVTGFFVVPLPTIYWRARQPNDGPPQTEVGVMLKFPVVLGIAALVKDREKKPKVRREAARIIRRDVTFLKILGSESFVKTVFASDHYCALTKAQTIVCWGRAGDKILAPPLAGAIKPVTVASDDAFVDLAVSRFVVCGITAKRTLICWGRLNLPSPDPSTVPKMTAFPEIAGVVRVAIGSHHACAQNHDGQLFCWGRGDQGALGYGGTDDLASPQKVEIDKRFTDVSVDDDHTCGVAEGEVYCWGSADNGQIGPTRIDALVPQRVVGFARATRVIAGEANIVVKADGSIASFGSTLTKSSELRVVPNRRSKTDVVAGRACLCVLSSASTLEYCVGISPCYVRFGNDGGTAETADLRADFNETRDNLCLTQRGHSTLCKGVNDAGILGDSRFESRSDPRPVPLCKGEGDADTGCWYPPNRDSYIHKLVPIDFPGNDEVMVGHQTVCVRAKDGIWCRGAGLY